MIMDEAEKEKLKILLNHWVEHNSEHAQEFSRWAEKAKSSGYPVVHDEIVQAIQQINKANEFLLKASERLKER